MLGTNHPLLLISLTPDQQAPCVGSGPGMQGRISCLSGLTGLGYLWEMAATVGEQESGGGGGRCAGNSRATAVESEGGYSPAQGIEARAPWAPPTSQGRGAQWAGGRSSAGPGTAGSIGLPAPTETTPPPHWARLPELSWAGRLQLQSLASIHLTEDTEA